MICREHEKDKTHIRPLLRLRVLEYLIQHINTRSRLKRDASQQALVVYVADEVLRARLRVGLGLGALGRTREGGLVVEAV